MSFIFLFEKIICIIFLLFCSYIVKDNNEGKEKVMHIIDKKEFFKMMLRDRLPLAKMDFSMKNGWGRIEFFWTPLGVAVRANVGCETGVCEIKMYDKNCGSIALQSLFLGDNFIKISDGVFVGVSSKLSIDEALGRNFLIRMDDMLVTASPQTVLKHQSRIDKIAGLVYN